MRHALCTSALTLLIWSCGPGIAWAAKCSAQDLAAAVDNAGAALRSFNAQAMPKLQDKLRQLKTQKGWTRPVDEEKVLARIRDKHTAAFDAKAEDLIVKIDTLGRPKGNAPPDCAALTELEAAGRELLAVMKAKSTYTLAKLEAEISPAPPPAAPSKADRSLEAVTTNKTAQAPATAAIAVPPPPARKSQAGAWDTKTELPVVSAPLPLPSTIEGAQAQTGYTIDEIREITRGFFGTISTSLASVLEHAFRQSGRPAGYVLGQEGGGAFLAGVRYGSGTLYLRDGGTKKVYWHGPSIGTDFGAAGSRTMFLIYNLREPSQLYRGFTGVDGSAYFVGGVGLTFLKGGDVIMAPIRSGLGFRLGANVGYIRFTPRATWNPF